MNKKSDGFLIEQPIWGVFNYIPIRILEIVKDDLFPIKFEYKGRGYKGLVFSERLNKIKLS